MAPTVKFIHTADWQLGMTRHFLDVDAQARYTAARIDAIASIGDVAKRNKCSFIVVCGDVFESNAVSPQTVSRSLEAMKNVSLPIYLLPGNHDPLDAASIYRAESFLSNQPDNVTVLSDPGPYSVSDEVEIVAAPWTSKNPTSDLAADALSVLGSAATTRILVAHGAVDSLAPDKTAPGVISETSLIGALSSGLVQYVALGDRHSTTQVRDVDIWYSGTQEVTSSRDLDPGNVLIVTLDQRGTVEIQPEKIGTWSFVDIDAHVDDGSDIALLETQLNALPAKDRTILRLSLVGTLSIEMKARLDQLILDAANLFASVRNWERNSHIAVKLSDDDLDALRLSGYAAAAVDELATISASGNDDSATAGNALSLLLRLQESTR